MRQTMSWLYKRTPVGISLLLLLVAVWVKWGQYDLIVQLQNKVFDAYQQQFPRQYEAAGVKIIDIDDQSLAKLGQWPWPRPLIADMIKRLSAAGSGPIAFDIVFAEADRTSPANLAAIWKDYPDIARALDGLPDHDQLLAEAFAEAYVVTGYALTHREANQPPVKKFGLTYSGYEGDTPADYVENYEGATLNLPALEEAAEGNGFFSTNRDGDGIIRRIPLLATFDQTPYFSLSMEALRVAQGAKSYHVTMSGSGGSENRMADIGITHLRNGHYQIPTDKFGHFLIYFTERTQDRYLPAWKIFEPDFDPAQVEGQILFVGTSAAGLQDLRATPLDPYLPGVELHAQAVEQILLNQFLYRPGYLLVMEIAGMAIGGLVLMAIMSRLTAVWGAVFMIAAQAGALSFSVLMFHDEGFLIDPISPSAVILVLYFSESLRRYIISESERKQVRGAFAQYMSPALVEELARHPEKLTLGGEIRPMTILFCDIRGFTTISEQFDAQGLTLFINRFLTPMTGVILDHKGTIDKYMGDCIMAFWNAPLDDADHARHGCLAALEMFRRLDALNTNRKQEAEALQQTFIPVQIGVGLNSGEICVGNMGSEQRFDYSVLGDDVNLASRLEGQSKTYGVNIVIGENTRTQVTDMATLELDRIQVKGKTQAVTIYALLGDAALADHAAFIALKELWEKMLKSYRAQGWDEAENLLNRCETACGKVCLADYCDEEERRKAGIQTSRGGRLDLSLLFALYRERIIDHRRTPPPENWDGVYAATSK